MSVGEHAVLLVLGLWWHANRKNRRSLAHNFTFPETVELARSGKLVFNPSSTGEAMQIAGTIQGSTQVRPQQGGNGNKGNGGSATTRRVFVPTAKPAQTTQSNPQSQQTRRQTMPDSNQENVTQVVQATITQDDVGKTVRVAASDVQVSPEVVSHTHPDPDPLAELRAQLEQMKRDNAQLRQDLQNSKDLRRGVGLTIKITDKGGISVYGLQRFPTTLYAQQWQRILAPEFQKAMGDFIQAHTLEKDGGKLKEGAVDASGAPIPHLTYQYPGQK